MPIIDKDEYAPSWWLRNGHINTIYPYLFRKQDRPPYMRERWDTLDGDFIDLDFIKNGSSEIVILSHGLEGSSDSQYIQSTTRLLTQNQFDVCALNYRSCSGDMNHTQNMYHSGFTTDIHMIVNRLAQTYNSLHLVGFSLGGNMNIKYTADGENKIHHKLKSVTAVSAPCDLAGSSACISSWYNYAYQRNFLKSLVEKMKIKSNLMPDVVKSSDIAKVNTLIDFDEYFTGPLHGFKGAQDYYDQCNSLQFMPDINIPTLLITAKDDPFLSTSCYPTDIAESNDNFHLLMTKYGGHVGFAKRNSDFYWLENQILQWIKSIPV